MPILIKTHSPDSALKEWAIIEIQGDIGVRGERRLHNQFIGDLNYNKYGQPVLIIGHHILQGREQKLDKPFAVLEQLEIDSNTDMEELHTSMASVSQSQSNTTVGVGMEQTVLDNTVALQSKTPQRTQYMVQAICTKKLIFKSRPKPIIANVAKNNFF